MVHLVCLNPCFNGRYSQRSKENRNGVKSRVLILVLMEDTLRASIQMMKNSQRCLNPCFNGRYSQRKHFRSQLNEDHVLILVLMEDTLRDGKETSY